MTVVATTTVHLPGVLRPAAGDVREVPVSGGTVRAALEDLFAQLPALRGRVTTETGALRPHVLVVHRGEVLRGLDDAPLADGDELAILPAVSGG